MRDVNFTDYASSAVAVQACADLNNMSYISGNHNHEFPYPVTPQNLFRGRLSRATVRFRVRTSRNS
jgi:hypothetical protein